MSEVNIRQKTANRRSKRAQIKPVLSPLDILEITGKKYKKAVKEAKPLFTWFSLTNACDLRCRLCYADSSKKLKGELTTEKVFQIIDNIAEAGTVSVIFGGGEPTLRKDLLEIVRYTSQFMNAAINTNGHLFAEQPEYLNRLVNAGLSQVKISVDGLKASHDWNRGRGSFDKTMKALENCKKAGVPQIILIMTATKMNCHEIPRLMNLAVNLGADFCMVEFVPTGRGKNEPDQVLTMEQRKEMFKFLHNAQKVNTKGKIQFENRYIIAEDKKCMDICCDSNAPCGFYDFSVGCITGIYQYCISATGKVIAGDVFVPELEVGDLTRERLSDIWRNSEKLKSLRNREDLKGKCGSCAYRFVCGGCRRRAYTFTGDLMGEDPACWLPDTIL
ncbi:MAG: radical SAM protein [Deltaproteobacteria bacterium]|nr:radical SAM protein [Deltaproteobacteria bacterium]